MSKAKAKTERKPRSYAAVKVHIDLERSGYKGCPPSMYQVWETCFENDRAEGGCPYAIHCSCFRVEVGALKRFESAHENWPDAVRTAEVLNDDFAKTPISAFKYANTGPITGADIDESDVPF